MQFAPSLVEKLRSQAQRFEALTELISTPEVATDGRRLPVLLQERGGLQASADLAKRLEELQRRRAARGRISPRSSRSRNRSTARSRSS
jgi:hypothetical protein